MLPSTQLVVRPLHQTRTGPPYAGYAARSINQHAALPDSSEVGSAIDYELLFIIPYANERN
jgi:hypothetical protein